MDCKLENVDFLLNCEEAGSLSHLSQRFAFLSLDSHNIAY